MSTSQTTPLANALEERGITQRAFAQTLGAEASLVNRWCRGHFRPNRFYRELIAAELKTTEEALWPKQS